MCREVTGNQASRLTLGLQLSKATNSREVTEAQPHRRASSCMVVSLLAMGSSPHSKATGRPEHPKDSTARLPHQARGTGVRPRHHSSRQGATDHQVTALLIIASINVMSSAKSCLMEGKVSSDITAMHYVQYQIRAYNICCL